MSAEHECTTSFGLRGILALEPAACIISEPVKDSISNRFFTNNIIRFTDKYLRINVAASSF
jgi:hypothetical protein